jgi:hypothetical protein
MQMRVDDRHKSRSLNVAVRGRKPADPSGQIFMQYLEAVRHGFILTNKA